MLHTYFKYIYSWLYEISHIYHKLWNQKILQILPIDLKQKHQTIYTHIANLLITIK